MIYLEKLKEITELSLKAGRIVCESSGETYRAEDTIAIIGRSLGASVMEPYVTPTGIILYGEIKDENARTQSNSRSVRIKKRATNLGKITAINSLSRYIAVNHAKIDFDTIDREIDEIYSMNDYGAFFSILSAAMSGFVFTGLFAGSLADSLISACLCIIMRIVLLLLSPLKLSSFFSTVIGGSVISFFSGLLSFAGVKMSFNIVNIGSLMYLMPGVAIVIAIRDIIGGDYVSGTSRAMEAFVIALSLSVGAAAGLLVFPSALDYNTSLTVLNKPISAFFIAAVASATFAFIFQVKNKVHIFLASLAGGISWFLYIILINSGVSSLQACFVGSFSAGIISEIFALAFKAPSTVFFIPALISFVPGGGMYSIMHNILLGKSEAILSSLFSTISIAGAIALAIAFATAIARVLSYIRRKLSSVWLMKILR